MDVAASGAVSVLASHVRDKGPSAADLSYYGHSPTSLSNQTSWHSEMDHGEAPSHKPFPCPATLISNSIGEQENTYLSPSKWLGPISSPQNDESFKSNRFIIFVSLYLILVDKYNYFGYRTNQKQATNNRKQETKSYNIPNHWHKSNEMHWSLQRMDGCTLARLNWFLFHSNAPQWHTHTHTHTHTYTHTNNHISEHVLVFQMNRTDR